MPRMYRKSTWIAAVWTGACLGLWSTASLWAQEESPPDAAACPPGARCAVGNRLGAHFSTLHGNDILNCRPRTYGQPDLFYNYYVPGTCGGVPAAMYLAPQPIPPLVGHTYYTYQPFLPHELLYQHHRTYYRYYDQGRGLTRTHISWYRPPIYIPSHFRIAR